MGKKQTLVVDGSIGTKRKRVLVGYEMSRAQVRAIYGEQSEIYLRMVASNVNKIVVTTETDPRLACVPREDETVVTGKR